MTLEELKGVTKFHHAYLVVGNAEESPSQVLELLGSRGIATVANPDVRVERYTDMTVDEVRDTLQSYAALKPLHEEKYLIVSFESANQNAQNALLKIVEDAPGGTHFFICIDQIGFALPTLRSRCITLTVERKTFSEELSDEAQEFLQSSYADRLAMVEKMSTAVSKTQDRTSVRALVTMLLVLSRMNGFPATYVRDLLDADGYLRLSGSSPKSILGHLAVTLPRQ